VTASPQGEALSAKLQFEAMIHILPTKHVSAYVEKSTALALITKRYLLISFGVIGQTEEIIHRDVIKYRQPDQHISGNIPLA